MDLSPDQQDKVQAALYQYNLSQSADPSNQSAVAQAKASGNLAEASSLQVDIQKQSLQDKLQILQGILTPEQLKTYQQSQLDMIDMEANAAKMFLPAATKSGSQ